MSDETSDLVIAQGLTKAFGTNRVLNGVSFTVPKGSATTVIGPSGSGKTTLLRSLNALDAPDGGVVTIGGLSVDFAGAVPKDLMARYRAQSAMVFQSHNLFPHKTVLQNVTEGPLVAQHRPTAEATAEALELLNKVGLSDKCDEYPYQLSGGQQQRVGIARALALRPHLVLFDEPTSALDPELVGDVLRVIRDLAAEGLTMVIVTHEIHFAREVSDQVLFIDEGLVLEQGPPNEVLGAPAEERTRQFLDRIINPL